MKGLWIFKGKIKDPYGEFMIEEHHDQLKENLNEDVNDAYPRIRYSPNTLTVQDTGNNDTLYEIIKYQYF